MVFRAGLRSVITICPGAKICFTQSQQCIMNMKILRPGVTGQHCLPNTIVCFCVISYGQSTHVAIWTRTMFG